MKKIISGVLILVGLVLISLPLIQNKLISDKTENVNRTLKDIAYEDIKRNTDTQDREDVEFEYEAIEDVSPTNVIFGTMNFDEKNIIGQLSIPDLNIDLPLLKGLTNSNLAVGVTTMRKDQNMGEGNYPVSGHNMKNKSLLFGSLMDIEVGSKAYITDKNTVYEYEIYDIEKDKSTEKILRKIGKNADTTIKVVTVTDDMDYYYQSKQYVSLSIDFGNRIDGVLQYRDLADEILRAEGIDAEITINLRGKIQGILNYSEKNKVANALLKELDAKVVSENRGNDLFTIYAYSENVEDSVICAGEKVNINISEDYDEIENMTTIYLSTPLNNLDY